MGRPWRLLGLTQATVASHLLVRKNTSWDGEQRGRMEDMIAYGPGGGPDVFMSLCCDGEFRWKSIQRRVSTGGYVLVFDATGHLDEL